jgi:replicative DNA helicase
MTRLSAKPNPQSRPAPPYDQDLEEQIIGALIVDDSIVFTIAQLITEEDFYIERLALLFTHILAMKASGKNVDIVSLSAVIEDAGHTNDIGGDLYLAELISKVQSTYSIRDLAIRVADLATRRRTLFACSEIARAAYTMSLGIDQIAEKSQGLITQALIGATARKTIPLGKLADGWFDEFEDFVKNGKIKGIPTPFPTLTGQVGGWCKTRMYLFTAPTGVGKSTILKSSALHAAKLGYKVGIWSCEMSEAEYLETLVSEYGAFDTMPGRIVNMTPDKRDTLIAKAKWAKEQVKLLPITIMHRPGMTTDQFFFEARSLQALGRLDLIIADYVQLVRPPAWFESKGNREQEMAYVSQMMKEFAQRLNLPLVTAAQLNDMGEVRESKAIGFNADFHITVMPVKKSDRTDPATGNKLQNLKGTVRKNRMGDKIDFHVLFQRSIKTLGETAASPPKSP